MSFTKQQPKDGDIMLHCGHINADRHHFFKIVGDNEYWRPDGTKVKPQWIISCHACFTTAGGNGMKIPIQAEVIWDGNDPIVEHTWDD